MQDHKEIVSELTQYIKSNVVGKLNLQRVILFGSYAKGTQKAHSDIDLALISPEYSECNYIDEAVKVMDLFESFDLMVEPHLFSPEEFDSDHWFPREIKSTGIPVFERV